MCIADFAGKVHVPLNEKDHRITNGLTASRGQFPWQVALIINGASFCGGSIISSQWVLTAGHCA
jgi:secreted trypsin-like serine protease